MVTLGICSLFSFVPHFLFLWISVSPKGSSLCSILPWPAAFSRAPTHTHTAHPCHAWSRRSSLIGIAKVNSPAACDLKANYVTSEEQNTKRSITTTSKVTEFQTNRIPWNLGEYDLSLGRCPENEGSMNLSDHPDRTRTYGTNLRRRQCGNVAFAQGCPNMPPACFLGMGWHFKSNRSAPNSPSPPPNFTEKKKFICRKNWGFFFFCMLIQT